MAGPEKKEIKADTEIVSSPRALSVSTFRCPYEMAEAGLVQSYVDWLTYRTLPQISERRSLPGIVVRDLH